MAMFLCVQLKNNMLVVYNYWYICVFYFRSKKLIAEAINDNDFLKNLDKKQIAEIVGCMYQREFKQHQYICKEGGVGTQLYVLASNDVIIMYKHNTKQDSIIYS